MNLTDKPVSTPKRSRFLNMLAGYGSANAAAQFMKMLFMLIMARYFGLEDYSDYVAAYSLASFTAIFSTLVWILGCCARAHSKRIGSSRLKGA